MSNARVFAWGWVLSGVVMLALDAIGWGPPTGFVSMMKQTMIGVSFGMSAVAVFGDRARGEAK